MSVSPPTQTANAGTPGAPLLEVDDLQTTFLVGEGQTVRAVDGVSFTVKAGETLAIVGESGSGKSVTSLSIMRLLPKKIGQISRGEIRLRGKDLAKLTDREMRAIRGNDIGMIFQEPMTSLNPVHTIGQQIAEVVIEHEKVSKAEANKRAIEMLQIVGIPEPARRATQFPHEMSGGMRQRAMIAMALACEPSVLIADEPTTALDVTIQAQILDLMRNLQERLGMAIVFITHDLGVVAEMAQRVVVMYAGQVVETGTVEEIFSQPLMPYTAGLMQSIPRMGAEEKTRLQAIPGYVPLLTKLPSGCRFRTRCAYAEERCAAAEPPLEEIEGGRSVRCIRWKELNLPTRASA
ncbi:ABC transporter ATP-binding protein [Devosia sp. FJ2-5-3]|jgi:oligopeptide/dipeptide ABC transporter ATP-binding protein|uniref:ABC transporter ATP-binding protein n=1 Tax=Devosia sp. FJ2-5-3 TaxID=2976680 RepID=UPI0023D7EE92|nr:ABC transporter ATP-binding protein [Devosia sp. FJ2-5-3]WEJ57071.1 ABC transporter ATP-binding protein [Devosia sp. FJ2-5-3]